MEEYSSDIKELQDVLTAHMQLVQQQAAAIIALTDKVADLKAEQDKQHQLLEVLVGNMDVQADLNRGFLFQIESIKNKYPEYPI
jgi:uncharacterized coiled-coil protein SlyX